MSCCNRRIPTPAPARVTPDTHAAWRGWQTRPAITPTLQYVGQTSLVVTGPATGRRYEFPRPGARTTVDPRDRASLLTIAALRTVAG